MNRSGLSPVFIWVLKGSPGVGRQTEVILQALKNFDLDNIYVASWIRERIEIENSRNDPSQ